MSSPDLGTRRFADHGKKLADLGGPLTTVEAAAEALSLVGDVLRRAKALSAMQRAATRALEKVDGAAAAAFVRSVDVAVEKRRLQQALDDAFEAMLADPDERPTWRDRALSNLAYRDRLSSIQTALAMMQGTSEANRALTEKLAQVDAGLSKKARMLVGLNEERRAELEALDSGEREAAWWFAARSKCDALVGLYSGEPKADAHLDGCEACKRDLAAAGGATKPKHVDAESLRRREEGTATAGELSWMDAHAKSCNACKRAVEALSVALPQEA